jgi:hypothetical protein
MNRRALGGLPWARSSRSTSSSSSSTGSSSTSISSTSSSSSSSSSSTVATRLCPDASLLRRVASAAACAAAGVGGVQQPRAARVPRHRARRVRPAPTHADRPAGARPSRLHCKSAVWLPVGHILPIAVPCMPPRHPRTRAALVPSLRGGMRRGAGLHPWDWTAPLCVQPLALTRSLMRRMRASFPQQVPRVAAARMSRLSRLSRMSRTCHNTHRSQLTRTRHRAAAHTHTETRARTHTRASTAVPHSTPKVPPHYPRHPDRTLQVPLQYPTVLPP